MIYRGTFEAVQLASGNATRQAEIAAGPLAATIPSGTLGALTYQIQAAVVPAVISVVDTGRGRVTSFVSSANNRSRVYSHLGSDYYKFTTAGTGRTQRIEAVKVVSGVESGFTDTVAPYDPGMDNEEPPAPLPDTRTALELALADAVNPGMSAFSLNGLIDRIVAICDAQETEGFIVVDEAEQQVVFFAGETGADTTFTAHNTLASIDASSFIGVYGVPAVVTQGGGGAPFIP